MQTEPRVTVFGSQGDSSTLLDQVRDSVTGKWFEYRARDDDEHEAEFRRLLGIVHPEGTSTQLVLAVLDTGIVHDHPSIAAVPVLDVDLTGEGDEDLNGHGTVVTLILLRGIGDLVTQLLNVKVAGSDGRGSPKDLVRGLEWVTDYKRQHPEQSVIANISAGVYSRRRFGLLACDGTCAVCRAARIGAAQGVSIMAAAGNTKGMTACPAMAGLRFPEAGISAAALAGYDDSGFGTTATHVKDLPRPVPIDEPPPVVVNGLSGDEADEAMLRLGEQFLRADDVDQAEKVFKQAITYGVSENTRGRASVSLTYVLAASGRTAEAEQTLRYALETDLDAKVRAEALYALGRIAWDLGRPDAAAQLQAAVAMGHSHFSPLSAHFIAIKLLAAHQEIEAIPYLDAAILSDESEIVASAQYNRAQVRRNSGETSAALADYAAVTSKPSNMQHKAALGMGSLLAAEGELEKALKWLRFASDGNDERVAALAELGMGDIGRGLGDAEAARVFYLRAVARDQDEVSALAQSRLEDLRE